MHEAAVDPVAKQDRAWLWAQVISAFTRQPVAKVPVKWTAAARTSEVETDESGFSGYAFEPETARQFDVEARVLSAYDGYEDKRTLTVNALARNLWNDVMVRFDGQTAQPWGEKTYFPRRKGQHRLEVLAAENSPLLGQELALGMTGTGPSELGVTFLAWALGTPRPFSADGLVFPFSVGDLKDGSFSLRLSATRLANLSPANAMSLGEGSQAMSLIGNTGVQQVLDWGQEVFEQVKVISATSGKPMVGVTVTWRSADLEDMTTLTDFYGVAKIRFVPKTPGATELTATVGDEVYSESIAFAFTVNEPRRIDALISPEPSGYPGQEVSAKATVVSARTGEPLVGVEVMWEFADVSLEPTLTGADGIATIVFKIPAGGGVLQASVRGGIGGWDVASLMFSVVVGGPIIEFRGGGSYFVEESPTIEFRVVSPLTGEPLENEEIFWSIQGTPETTRSGPDGGVLKVVSSNGMVGYKKVHVSLRDPAGAVVDERWATFQFFDRAEIL